MAKKIINIGNAANDGTGDPLRTAFDKINDNFDEIYAELGGGTLSNISITGNSIISDDLNGNINLTADGSGKIVINNVVELPNYARHSVLVTGASGDVETDTNLTWHNSALTVGAFTFGGLAGSATTIMANSPDGSTLTDLVLDAHSNNIVPNGNQTKNLGTVGKEWNSIVGSLLKATGDRVNVTNSYTPAAAIGATGDAEGDICWDSSYIYVCTGNYDGITAIWGRIPLLLGW